MDIETPPNSKLFDLTSISNTNDIDQLSKRRLAANTSNTNTSPSGSNVTFNIAGVAELVNGQAPSEPQAVEPASKKSLPPQISLDTFCLRYDISANLHTKLAGLGVQGPHALCFLSNADLQGEGKLLLGEVGELRDTKEHWNVGDENRGSVLLEKE